MSGGVVVHSPVAAMSYEGIPSIHCSCGKRPVPWLWLRDHWVGDESSGIAAINTLIAKQATGALRGETR